MRKCPKFGIYLQLSKTELTAIFINILMQRAENENAAGLRGISKRSDQLKIENSPPKYSKQILMALALLTVLFE